MAKKKIEDEVQDTEASALEAPAPSESAAVDISAPVIPMIAPTVGRIVHFGVPASAAIITSVGDGGAVGLAVFPDDATPTHAANVPYAEAAKLGCWTWPPR